MQSGTAALYGAMKAYSEMNHKSHQDRFECICTERFNVCLQRFASMTASGTRRVGSFSPCLGSCFHLPEAQLCFCIRQNVNTQEADVLLDVFPTLRCSMCRCYCPRWWQAAYPLRLVFRLTSLVGFSVGQSPSTATWTPTAYHWRLSKAALRRTRTAIGHACLLLATRPCRWPMETATNSNARGKHISKGNPEILL